MANYGVRYGNRYVPVTPVVIDHGDYVFPEGYVQEAGFF